MASIFKPPYISSAQLSSLLVEDGQLVFNIDDKQFYTGNGVLGGRNIASEIPVPSKTSDLTNDSGFITADDISIPTKTSDLTNDSGFITADDIPSIEFTESDPIYLADKPYIALKSELFSKSYNDLTDKPELFQPTTDGDGTNFLADDGTYKNINLQSNSPYYIQITDLYKTTSDLYDLTDISINQKDGILYNRIPMTIGSGESLNLGPLTLNFQLNNVKTVQLWLTAENPSSEQSDLNVTTSIIINDGLNIVDADTFPETLEVKSYVQGNTKLYRIFVFIIRCIPLYDGSVQQFINYSHYFDVSELVR